MIDTRNVWAVDDRPIVAACLLSYPVDDGILQSTDGWAFERFERNGEMASIPYLLAIRREAAIEAPLTAWSWVEFTDRRTDG